MIQKMIDDLSTITSKIESELKNIDSLSDLEKARIKFLGKKGAITAILKNLSQLSDQEKPIIGKLANEVKEKAQSLLLQKENQLKREDIEKRLGSETVDITLPGSFFPKSSIHPLNQVLFEIEEIFVTMGFDIKTGPDVETDSFNFTLLNIPPEHPARDMQDTFYITDELLLRTHTSPVQIRVMKKQKPPIAFIAPGKVYRRDADITHSPMFSQVEGLMVDKKISFSDLKGVLENFVHCMFGEEFKLRFRPSFFPFTEPSAEVDVSCIMCKGTGCRICSNSGWLEIIGAGMVHPAVFENVGYNPNEISGFAFGMGVERIAMLKYRINDIRLFFESDLRFLSQF